MNIFVASSSGLRPETAVLIETLTDVGYRVCDWVTDFDNVEGKPLYEVANGLLDFICESDALVWFVDPDHPSEGAPFEAGYAFAIGIPVLVYAPRGLGSTSLYPHLMGQAHILEDVDRVVYRLEVYDLEPELTASRAKS